MSELKLCPLKFNIPDTAPSNLGYGCECGTCAWWDDFTGHCAILAIARHGSKGTYQVVIEERREKEIDENLRSLAEEEAE